MSLLFIRASFRDVSSVLRTSYKPNHLPKDLPPNTITMNARDNTHRSVHVAQVVLLFCFLLFYQ